MSEFEVGLEAPGIGAIRVVPRIIAIPQQGGYYNPQYQIVGATPEDTAKLCRIKDVQAFLDHSAPGAPISNAEALADALGGIAVSEGTVEGLPKGGQLNADHDNLGPQARQAITDTINRCKATLQERTPDTLPNDGRFTATKPFQSGVFDGAGVTPVAVGLNDPISPPPAFVTRNVAAPQVSFARPGRVGQTGDGNVGDWWKSVAPTSSNINPFSVRGLSPPGIMPAGPNQPSQAAGAPLGFPGGATDVSPTLASPGPGLAHPLRGNNTFTDWWNGLVADVDAASRQAGLGGLNPPVPNNVPAPPTQPLFDRGLSGMLQRAGAFDPPAGGLLGRLLELQRNHPDDDDAFA